MGVKAFFRYLRGELLNGYYIRALNLVSNNLPSIEDLKVELLYWLNVVADVNDPDYPIRREDLRGMAQVAGVLSIRGLSGFLKGWFRLSESTIVSGTEYSNRGLLNQETGRLEYITDPLPEDISTLATNDLRMPLIPEGAVPIGYVWNSDGSVMTDEGKIDYSKLHTTPPDGYVQDIEGKWYWPLDPVEYPAPAYSPYFGNQYLSLTSSFPMVVELTDDILQLIFVYHQKIKKGGPAILYIFELTDAIIPDLISDLKIELLDAFDIVSEHVYYYKMTFNRDKPAFEENDGWGRFSAWAYFIQSKYPFINFSESGE